LFDCQRDANNLTILIDTTDSPNDGLIFYPLLTSQK